MRHEPRDHRFRPRRARLPTGRLVNALLLTYGTRGDVQPFVALGRALARRGDVVTVAAPERFGSFVEENGLRFAPVSDEMIALLDTAEGKEMIENTRSILDSVRHNLRFLRRIRPMLRTQLEDCWTAAQASEPDVVVFHPKGFAGPLIAERFGCPAVLALTFPMLVPTGERPHLGFPSLPFGRRYNRLTHHLVNTLASLAMRKPLKQLRARIGLPSAKRYDVRHAADGARLPTMTAVSPAVVPEPSDWPETDRMVGFWFLDDDSAPSEELAAFVEAGPAPVYVGFGSMAGKDPERLARVAVEALRRTGQRGVLATGWGGLTSVPTDERVLTVEQAPHSWLFPRTAAIVHHGGAGTTAAALRAGVPSIVAPFMGDQPFWAERVHALGVGPKGIPQKKLTVAGLSRAIEIAVGDEAMRARASALGERIRAEDGTGVAVAFLESLLEKESRRA
jgi:sterol 3beta-glucosyltransferase